jgi:hypothetical protein
MIVVMEDGGISMGMGGGGRGGREAIAVVARRTAVEQRRAAHRRMAFHRF